MNVVARGLFIVFLLAGTAKAQTVHLPSFETFSYSGSVLVPDQGSTSLGGISRAATSSNRRGVAGSFSNSGASVSATIINLDAMDRAIRGSDASRDDRIEDDSRAAQTDRGKALVRLARKQYRAGKEGLAFQTYRIAISTLEGNLRELASKEFQRLFGIAASQVQ